MPELRNPAIVLPVYNEGRTVSTVLDAVRLVHAGLVIVVNDGSTDETAAALARRSDTLVISHPDNRGYGRSLIDGFAEAIARDSDAIVTMDCDGQHEPAHIPEFLNALSAADIVSGSRYLAESPVLGAPPLQRLEVNRAVTAMINDRTGWSLSDAFCGFKAYRADALKRIHLSEAGYAMPLELWAQAYLNGLSVMELPVTRIYFDGDRSFGEDLDDPDRRLGYYVRVWQEALGERGGNG